MVTNTALRIFSQRIGHKGIKFSGFGKSHTGVVIRKCDEDWSKSLPLGLFSSNFPGWGQNSIPE